MTEKRIEQILREEAEHGEKRKNAPLRDGTMISHKNQRSYVFSIRLSEAERIALEEVADRLAVAPSALSRQWLCDRLVSHSAPTDVRGVADA